MDTLILFMLFISVPCVCLTLLIVIGDIVRLIQLLIKGPYLAEYNEPVSVKCVNLVEVKVTKEFLRHKGYSGRKTAWVMRPSFSGFYKGKNFTFCRKKDWQQPVAEVGRNYTIYVKNGNINCHDFYEEEEKIILRKRRRKRLIIHNFCMLLMVLWVAATYFIMHT